MIIPDRLKTESGIRVLEAFESGYINAARSFSKFVGVDIGYVRAHHGLHIVDGEYETMDLKEIERYNADLLVATDVIGEVSGKSYLLLNTREFDQLSARVYGTEEALLDFKEEFIKELDNILSASVITKLSNALDLNMYGNIPILVNPFSCSLKNMIYDDFAEEAESVYINVIHFTFDKYPELKPCFIWVVNQDIFDRIESKPVHS
jgi:chemotaxis protein CheY-P-specific phosphatase CheC